MAQAKTPTPETEELMNELAALRKDFGALAKELRNLGESKSEALSAKAAERVVALKSAGERQVEKAGEVAERAVHEAQGYAREHPATTLAATAVLGFIVGALTARR
jgi:ElaB/YqjD/DUF883 family membrane-anchored ribosome-binding protein